MKRVNACLGVLFAVLLFGIVYLHIPFHLQQLEHTSLFLEDWDWFVSMAGQLGGVSHWLAAFGIQFFDRPIVGSLMFIFPICLQFVVMALLLQRKNTGSAVWMPLAAWVSMCQLVSLYDYNFYWASAIALTLVLVGLLCLSFLPASYYIRSVLFMAGIPMMAWLAGSVALVYTVGGILLFSSRKDWIQTVLLPLLVYVSTMVLACYQVWCPSWATAFSPLMYYEPLIPFPFHHWSAWICVVAVLGAGRVLPVMDGKKKALVWTVNLLGWVLPCAFWVKYGAELRNDTNHDLWRLNHYAYMEDWDSILEFLKERPMNNFLFMNYANMALAEKGMLGDRAFHYRPRGVDALKVSANSTGPVRLLVSDVNYTVGCIAEAQQHAFEAQVTFPHSMGIQTLKRLVKTNLIFGHYAVAEKYLSLIGKTTFHKGWAEKYKAFLYNDEAVEKDAELGSKRRDLSTHNRFAMFYGWQPELEDIVEAHPQNEKALVYLGLFHLLSKDMKGFRAFMDKYYAQKDVKEWPLVFQQGQVMMLHQNGETWEDAGLSSQVISGYSQFLAQYSKNRQRPNFKDVMNRSFGHTFWYYFIFV